MSDGMKISYSVVNNYVRIRITDSDLSDSELSDFHTAIENFIKNHGEAPNLMIESKDLPHFPSFDAFREHVKFVHEKSKVIQKVAIVTDSMLGDFVPQLVNVMTKADVKHFKMADEDKALAWLEEAVPAKA